MGAFPQGQGTKAAVQGGQSSISCWKPDLVICKSHLGGTGFGDMKWSQRATEVWHCVAGLPSIEATGECTSAHGAEGQR